MIGTQIMDCYAKKKEMKEVRKELDYKSTKLYYY